MPTPDPSSMRAKVGLCLVCGQPLTGAFWITAHPHGVHEVCRDWSEVPFPCEAELRHLRATAKTLARAYWTTVRLGRWLAGVKRQWPAGGRAALEEERRRFGQWRAELRAMAERLR